jgi:hypothetical protein
VIVENIRRFEEIDLEKTTWKKIWRMFVTIIIEEKKARDSSEIKVLEPIENRENIDEDEHPCAMCTDLCYLSHIHCS